MPIPVELARAHGLGLAGQVAVVTGASSGLGRCCALALGEAGAMVVVNHLPRSADRAAEVVAAIEQDGGRAMAFAADVSREDEVQAMFAETVRRFGTVHILVNNAGMQRGAPFQAMSLAQWQQVIDVNLTGQFLCAREAVRRTMALRPELLADAALDELERVAHEQAVRETEGVDHERD